MGIVVVSYTIRDISDDQGWDATAGHHAIRFEAFDIHPLSISNSYLAALGVKRTAEVQRDAAVGEAEARRDAGIRVYQKSG